jgi:replicative DNA helicase
MQIQKADVLTQETLKYYEERKANPDLFRLISTGIRELDEQLGGGYQRGQLLYAAGPQKTGKSTFLLNLALAGSNQGLTVAFFGAEMLNVQVATIVLSRLSGVHRTTIRKLDWTPEEWNKLVVAGEAFSLSETFWGYGLTDMQSVMEGIAEIEEAGKPVDIVCIDYVQLMNNSEIKNNRQAELESISRYLKRLSLRQERAIAVIAAAQINRESIRSKLFDANSVLGSGAFERDADALMLITDTEDQFKRTVKNRKTIHLVASRESETGKVDVYYNGKIGLITSINNTNRIDIGSL